MLLNPIPLGFFVAALVLDITYKNTAEILWVQAASWLNTLGLMLAIIPGFINLLYICFRAIPKIRKIEIIVFFFMASA